MIKWFRELKFIVKYYRQHQRYLESEIAQINKILRQVTDVHVDLSPGPYYPTTVITIGRYKGRDYVDIFQIRDEDLKYIVNILRDMRRHAKIRRVDAPIEFKGLIDHELRDV